MAVFVVILKSREILTTNTASYKINLRNLYIDGVNHMAYQDNYLKYFESVPAAIEKCKETGNRLVLGYTSDLDAIATCDEATFNMLIDKYLTEEPSYVEEAVYTMSDFVRIFTYFAMNGLGGEVDIASEAVVDEMKECFEMTYSLGDTCAQSTGALAVLVPSRYMENLILQLDLVIHL